MKKIIGLLVCILLLSSCLSTLNFFELSNKKYIVKKENITILKIYNVTDIDSYIWIVNINDSVLMQNYDAYFVLSNCNDKLKDKIENGKYTIDIEIIYNYLEKNVSINPIMTFYNIKKCDLKIERITSKDINQEKGTDI